MKKKKQKQRQPKKKKNANVITYNTHLLYYYLFASLWAAIDVCKYVALGATSMRTTVATHGWRRDARCVCEKLFHSIHFHDARTPYCSWFLLLFFRCFIFIVSSVDQSFLCGSCFFFLLLFFVCCAWPMQLTDFDCGEARVRHAEHYFSIQFINYNWRRNRTKQAHIAHFVCFAIYLFLLLLINWKSVFCHTFRFLRAGFVFFFSLLLRLVWKREILSCVRNEWMQHKSMGKVQVKNNQTWLNRSWPC